MPSSDKLSASLPIDENNNSHSVNWIWRILIIAGALLVLAVIVWQAFGWQGNPDPTSKSMDPMAAMMGAGIIVLREGLEAILILAALTASLTRKEGGYWKPVGIGAGLAFLASIVTWFVVVAILASVSAMTNASTLAMQAATGILAVVILLIILNWFFHKMYWTRWIGFHNKRKQSVINSGTGTAVFRGLVLVGFASVYREGFEIVLFLQHLRLQAGSGIVLAGVAVGLFLTGIIAVLTFYAHAKLPYKKMLIFTGVLIAAVLVVMVGETVGEMQLAGWSSSTALNITIPGWAQLWFAMNNTVEVLGAQVLTIVYVIGTYAVARMMLKFKRRKKQANFGKGKQMAGNIGQ